MCHGLFRRLCLIHVNFQEMDLLSSSGDFYFGSMKEKLLGKISYSVKIQKAPLLLPSLKNMKRAHVLVLCFFKIHFYGIVQTVPGSPAIFFPFGFSTELLCAYFIVSA